MFSYYWAKVIKKIRGKAIKQSLIDNTSKVEAGSQLVNVKMDKYSFCGYDCKIMNCTIGAFCSIADGVIIGGANHPYLWGSTSPTFYQGRDSVKKKFSNYCRPEDQMTLIGNDVWIGDRAIIKAGVVIADGAVVGMGSIVTKNIGPYEIWAGNPAKLIKKRFSDELISKYVESKWWEKDDDLIDRCSAAIKNPNEFVEHFLEDNQ